MVYGSEEDLCSTRFHRTHTFMDKKRRKRLQDRHTHSHRHRQLTQPQIERNISYFDDPNDNNKTHRIITITSMIHLSPQNTQTKHGFGGQDQDSMSMTRRKMEHRH